MNRCPDEIRNAVAEIMRIALLRIRHAAGSGDSRLCFIESDHVHNLPQLVKNFSTDLLLYYLNVEREAYLEQLGRHSPNADSSIDFQDVRQMQPSWDALGRHARLQTHTA